MRNYLCFAFPFVALVTFSSCGSATFTASDKRQAADPQPATTATTATTATATATAAATATTTATDTGTGTATATATATPTATATAATTTQTLSLTCDQLASSSTAKVSASLAAGSQVQIAGQICPASAHELTVLFVVDWSGSMSQNDPVSGGTCGRLQAAQAIISSIQQQMASGDSVNVGLVPFASNVPQASVIAPEDIQTFAGAIDESTFCQALTDTDYIAAFSAAGDLLAGVPGNKIIYFISDGEPDVGTVQANEQAGASLRSAIPNLTINGLLLGADGAAAEGVLTAITGAADRVKLVANASDLATSILSFAPPTLDPSAATATLGGAPLALQSFTQDASKADAYDFTTAPFALAPTAPQTMALTLTVKATDGSTQTVAIEVDETP